jgi:hypothetical protein
MWIRRALLVALLTLVAIELHEAGHWLAYRALGHSVHRTLQRVIPLDAVPPAHQVAALLAGPLVSVAAAVGALVLARRRRTFAWSTASFTNASLRLFPLCMDLWRALRGAHPFSDEGEVGELLGARMLTLELSLLVVVGLTLAAASTYRERRWLTAGLVYLQSLAIGVGVVLADELLARR